MKKLNFNFTVASISLILFLGSNIALAEGDASVGKTKYAQCAYCHGENAQGMGTNPRLAGIEKAVFANHLAAFKSGTRKNPMMENMAKRLSEQDVEDLAAYFASL